MANLKDESSKETLRLMFFPPSSGENDQDTSLLYAYKFVASLDIFLTITATLGNILILVALHKDTSLHPPSKILLRSLAITDLCVGVIGQPLSGAYMFSALFEHWSLCRVLGILYQHINAIFAGVSLLTLNAISVDRLLALLLRLRYRQVVTVKRVRAAVFLFWLINSVLSILAYVLDMNVFFLVTTLCTNYILPLLISTYSYIRIVLTIRRQQIQVQDTLGGQTGNTGLNMARYKKTVFNALWVHITLVACYTPFGVVSAVIAVQGLTSSLFLAQILAFTLVYLNSSLNPVLYCWKIKEVRQAVKETIREFCACLLT